MNLNDPAVIARVQELYQAGATQRMIAGYLGTTQKVIWRLMKRHHLSTRRPTGHRVPRSPKPR